MAEPRSTWENSSFLPWIAAHWQVAQFDKYFASRSELLAQALPWLRERGSAASVRRALGWLGYTDVRIEEDGALLHIDPGKLVQNSDLRALAFVVRESLSVHVAFYRIFHGDDMRAGRYDVSSWDGALWDDDSGSMVDVGDGSQIKVNQWQGHTTISTAPPLDRIVLSTFGMRHTAVTSADSLEYDSWVFDSEITEDVILGSTGITTSVTPTLERYQAVPCGIEVHTSVCAWDAPAPITTSAGSTANTAPIPLDDSRTWQGSWDSATWAVVCPTTTIRLD